MPMRKSVLTHSRYQASVYMNTCPLVLICVLKHEPFSLFHHSSLVDLSVPIMMH